MPADPFEYVADDGRRLRAIHEEDRCAMVQSFSVAECRQALQHVCLQTSVYQAIQRRMRALERQRLGRTAHIKR